MSDELDKSIKQAIEMLSNPDSLKGMLELLGNTMGSQSSSQSAGPSPNQSAGQQQSQPQNEAPVNNRSQSSMPGGDLEGNMELLRRVQEVVGVMNSNKDPRINLLTAITPFMSKKRQRAVSDCVQFMRMSQLLPLLFNNGMFKPK